jgi:glycosyltransferase involved in cell wall biosynthesis
VRVSFLLSSLWLSGGVRVIVEYANRLTERGYDITLIAPRGTLDPDIVAELGAGVTLLTSNVARTPESSLWQNLRLTWSLARAVPASDVVVSTHTSATVAGLLASRLWRRGRLVWLYQDFREMFAGRPYEDWLLRHALLWHECALVVSQYARHELESFTDGKVVVVGEGLSHAEFFRPVPVEARRGSGGPRTIMFLGDMRPRKGLFDFLQAAALVYQQLKDIRLLIVSKEACQIESTVPLEYVYRPTRAELARLYATCDLFVSASWRESFGLPPLEAMACGAPVVLTDSGGVREYALPDRNCLMAPARDPQALAAAMERVLTDTRLAEDLRRGGPPTAARFTWESAVDRLDRALTDLFAAA